MNKTNLELFAHRWQEYASAALSGFTPGARLSSSKVSFDSLANDLFRIQCETMPFYASWCKSKGVYPGDQQINWSQIPSIPTLVFKEMEVTSLTPEQREVVFYSSGTTESRPSRQFHHQLSLSVYEESALLWFEQCLCPEGENLDVWSRQIQERKRILMFLTPPLKQVPHSSLVHMFDTIQSRVHARSDCFYAEAKPTGGWTLDISRCLETLTEAVRTGVPVMVLGTAFSWVHFLDEIDAQKRTFFLPEGSWALETGGYKGKSREVPRNDLHEWIARRMGIKQSHIFCEYGMCELSSQAYDCWKGELLDCRGIAAKSVFENTPSPSRSRREEAEIAVFSHAKGGPSQNLLAPAPTPHKGNEQDARFFHFPPWARCWMISPETGGEVPEGTAGLIQLLDLANIWSVMAVQTGDLGVDWEVGFQLNGRANNAEIRGCSLMVEG